MNAIGLKEQIWLLLEQILSFKGSCGEVSRVRAELQMGRGNRVNLKLIFHISQ